MSGDNGAVLQERLCCHVDEWKESYLPDVPSRCQYRAEWEIFAGEESTEACGFHLPELLTDEADNTVSKIPERLEISGRRYEWTRKFGGGWYLVEDQDVVVKRPFEKGPLLIRAGEAAPRTAAACIACQDVVVAEPGLVCGDCAEPMIGGAASGGMGSTGAS